MPIAALYPNLVTYHRLSVTVVSRTLRTQLLGLNTLEERDE